MAIEQSPYEGIYYKYHNKRKSLVTKGDKAFFNEYTENGYREWDPRRSKVAAAIAKRIKPFPVKSNTNILYLGASHGYTCSFLAAITKGKIFAVEFAPRVMRDLLVLAKQLEPIIPIFANAHKPQEYKHRIENIDVVIQDVAQRDQVGIFLKNLKLAKPKAYGLLALKSRSVDVTKRPRQVAKDVEHELKKHLKIIQIIDLAPFEKDHFMFLCQKK